MADPYIRQLPDDTAPLREDEIALQKTTEPLFARKSDIGTILDLVGFKSQNESSSPTANGTDAIAGGPGAVASAANSVALGKDSLADRRGQVSFTKHGETDLHPAYGGIVGWYGRVTGTSLQEIFLNGVASSRLVVNTNSIVTFTLHVNIIMTTPTQESASFIFNGAISNIENTTSFQGPPFKTIAYRTDDAMDASIEADNINNSLVLKVSASDEVNYHYCSAQAFITEIR